MVADRGWKRPFDDPIPLPRGRRLVTLEDAARYVQKLPKGEQQLDEWQAAVEALLVVDNNGPTVMARIGFMRESFRSERLSIARHLVLCRLADRPKILCYLSHHSSFGLKVCA
jgi:hypothetical protein